MWRNKRYKNNQLLKRIEEETVKKPDTDKTGINFYLTINEYNYHYFYLI